MKFNCDWLGEYLYRWKRDKDLRQSKWHIKFKLYARLGYGDCRICEKVEARLVSIPSTYTMSYVYRWEYREIKP